MIGRVPGFLRCRPRRQPPRPRRGPGPPVAQPSRSSPPRRHNRQVMISRRHDPPRPTAHGCGPSDHASYTSSPSVTDGAAGALIQGVTVQPLARRCLTTAPEILAGDACNPRPSEECAFSSAGVAVHAGSSIPATTRCRFRRCRPPVRMEDLTGGLSRASSRPLLASTP